MPDLLRLRQEIMLLSHWVKLQLLEREVSQKLVEFLLCLRQDNLYSNLSAIRQSRKVDKSTSDPTHKDSIINKYTKY